ncbi:hypothetical protein ACIOC2_08975 [Streptomyces sp. NPDC088337]
MLTLKEVFELISPTSTVTDVPSSADTAVERDPPCPNFASSRTALS